MRITLEQHPGFVQNIETLGMVDLSDNNPALLVRLMQLLDAARENVALAMAAQGIEDERRRVQCPGCFASFVTPAALEAHRRAYHGWDTPADDPPF